MARRVRRVAVLGGSGMVGSRLVELAAQDDRLEVLAPSHRELDVLDPLAVTRFVAEARPDVLLNVAAWADVDGAEAERGDESGTVFRLNARFPGTLARACGAHGVFLVHVSTDYVFDGTRADRPYVEQDTPNPPCWYARTKWLGEQAVLDSGAAACVARIEMPFRAGAHRKRDLARLCLERLRAGQPITAVVDQRITPVFLDDAARALLALGDARRRGIVHVAAASWTTPYEFARAIARRMGLPLELVQPANFDEFVKRRPAPRPQHSWLDVSLFAQVCGPGILRPVTEQLEAWAEQLAVAGRV